MMERRATLYADGEISVFGVDYESKLTLHQLLGRDRIVVKWHGGRAWSGRGERTAFPTTLQIWKISEPKGLPGRTEKQGNRYEFQFIVEQEGILIRSDALETTRRFNQVYCDVKDGVAQ